MSNALLSVTGVNKFFGNYHALQDVNLEVEHGEFIAMLGPSGCGKTTLLRSIAGFLQPDRGQIRMDGEDVTRLPPNKRPVNTVFQNYALFPHLRILENVAYGPRRHGASRTEASTRAEAGLELVGLGHLSSRYPRELSGGQQQRVALARALVNQPKLLLLDEPLSALDAKLRKHMQIELKRLQQKLGISFVFVTHDQEEAMTMAHRLAVMTEGQIVQCGTPQDVYAFPNSRFVAGFIGSTNLLTGTIVVDEPDHVAIECAELTRPLYVSHGVSEPLGMEVHVSIRPERLVVSRTQPQGEYNWAHGMVSHMAWMGSYALYQVRLDSGKVVEASVPSLQLAQIDAPGIDEEIFVSWDADSATVLAS